jgi:hypothetical protein
MKNNLVAVKRMNKNGVMVTKHVRAESLTGGKTDSIAAPTLKKPAAKPEFQSPHVAYNYDPRVMRGEVLDRVVVGDTLYSRSREGVRPGEFQSIRVQLSRPLKDGDDDRIASMVGYAFRVALRTKYGSVEVDNTDTPYSVILEADTYYAGTSNLAKGLEKFEEQVVEIIDEGSPVRTTERAGPGTKDTRAVQGFNEDDLTFEIYYDNVEGDEAMKVAKERGVDLEAIDTVLSHDVRPLAEGAL